MEEINGKVKYRLLIIKLIAIIYQKLPKWVVFKIK